ncbi:hypothetical protein CC86DRAFT_295957 [Ophiobolus disseminans]|uniref:Uncharacterized protein n=1 Tax=Ophiobolus disseminans TaxID=1469910 RepID=A0A6A6ZUQ9_9PLEO|nr:hypothetical protein CC86DRAFT_295957 [Ophiobolus disseminans]
MKKGFFSIVFFANMWQLLVSLLYINTNALLTCFCVESEWQSFSRKPKSLRVTSPTGQQRSTYFLSLPWRYSLPLMGIFTTLHWTLSQAIFLTVVTTYKPESYHHDMIFLGTSPRALILTVSIGLFIMLGFVAMCFRTSDGILPRGGSCSAVISAACHRPSGDGDAAQKPVQWGEASVYGAETRNVGHCCFTSYEVIPPRSNRKYR